MEKNAIVILFLALSSTSSAANFFLGPVTLFPFFLSSSIHPALPFDFTQKNRIHAEGGSIYFQNQKEYYDRLQASEYVEHKKDTPTVTQSVEYQFPSEQHQGSYAAAGSSQKRPTQYVQNQGHIQGGQIHNRDQLAQYGGTAALNSPLQYSQDKQGQAPQIGQNYYNTAQNSGSSVAQNIPVQYPGTAQNFQQGISTIRPLSTNNRFGQAAAEDQENSSDFQANKGSKEQTLAHHQTQQQTYNDQLSQYAGAAALNRPNQFQENKQSQVPQVGQNYNPVQNVPLNQNLAVQYPGAVQSQQAQNFQQRIPTVRPLSSQNRLGQNQAATGAPIQPLSDQITRDRVDPNSFQGNTASNVQIPVKQPGDSSSTSVTGFGLEIMKILDRAEAGNLVMSPYSVALILALLQQGTRGEAQMEITRALGMSPLLSREFFRQVDSTMKSRRSRNTLKTANAIFVSNSITTDPQYKTDATKYFGSNFVSTNFDNGQLAARKLNDWVHTSTQGLIPNLVTPDSFSADTQLLLANAIYFKGLWNETFSSQRTIMKNFHLSDGSTIPANFMHNSGYFQSGRYADLNADFLVLPFEGFQYSLIVIVPSAKSSITSIMSQIQPQHIANILRAPHREAIVSLPKFKIRVDMDLTTPLIGMGIDDIFTLNSGLTALVAPGGARPRVTGALHTAVLSIDEKGGSAAAATLLAVSTLSLDSFDQEFMFTADRPFIAMLWDMELSMPLFMAKIADPTLAN